MAQIREWCFTLHHDWEEFTDALQALTTHKWFRYMVYQVERGNETSLLHIQGYIEFKRSLRMNKVKTLMNSPSVHLEPRQGTRKQARDYCMKEESRWANPMEFGEWTEDKTGRTDLKKARELILGKRHREDLWTDPELDPIMTKYPRWAEKLYTTKPVDIKVDIELRPWQTDVIGLLDTEPVRRRIIWVWSNQSNTGKSTFGDYLSTKYRVLPCINAKLWDIMAAYDSEDVIWIDLARADKDYASYRTLELLSNHSWVLSTKGTNVHKKYVKSHIFVTSNHAPNERALPQRFHTICIDDTPAPLTAQDPSERSEDQHSAGEIALHRLHRNVPDE